MIIFVTGEDGFSAARHVQAMKRRFSEKYDASNMNVTEFLGKPNLQIGSIVEAACSPGFLSDRRMVIVDGLLSQVTRKPDAKPWIEALAGLPKEHILILIDAISDKKFSRHALQKGLSEQHDVHTYHFPASSPAHAQKHVLDMAREQGLPMTQQDAGLLVRFVGTDMWQLFHEVSKLGAFAKDRQLTSQDIELLVVRNTEDAMFDFIDAISMRNAVSASQLLDAQRQAGISDFHLFAMIVRQIRLLLGTAALMQDGNVIKQELAAELGVHPFVAQKLLGQAQAFVYEDLIALHDAVFRFDEDLKAGRIDARSVVDRVFVALVRPECLTK